MDKFILALFGVLIVIALFFILREVYCWYFKINERMSLMERQIDQSRETNRLLTLLLQEKQEAKRRQNEYDTAATLELSSTKIQSEE